MSDTLSTVTSVSEVSPIEPAPATAPKRNRKFGKRPTGAPDYANMSSDQLLAAFWSYASSDVADIATTAINTLGAGAAAMVRGDLAAMVAVGIGLRKAYGRGVKVGIVRDLLPTVTIPDGFNPTFALFLSAARLRPDDASERKVASEVRAGIRKVIRDKRRNA